MLRGNGLFINFDNSFHREMDGFYIEAPTPGFAKPSLIAFNDALSKRLGIARGDVSDDELAQMFSSGRTLPGANPLSQFYAGHQFGGFSPILGDGRAVLLGEVVDNDGQRLDIQLKGAGMTPFSRPGSDGKAALGPVLREYLVSEAMHALGIPTSRALAAVKTGEDVYRDAKLPGAVLTRVASSHIRVGTFQFFASQERADLVRKLADYAIDRHYPDLAGSEKPYLGLLDRVASAQAELISKWGLVGFVHGVMNTDNMTISGETIDYGPCAFVDRYQSDAVFSSIDEFGRYAYANQPNIGQWNLHRLAESLLAILGENEQEQLSEAADIIRDFPRRYQQFWVKGMRAKLGLLQEEESDLDLANDLFGILDKANPDFTNFFRSLSGWLETGKNEFASNAEKMEEWGNRWLARHDRESASKTTRIASMNAANPLYIPRNHKVEEMIEAAVAGDSFEPFHTLLDVVTNPFEGQPGREGFARPAPDGLGPYRTFCGT